MADILTTISQPAILIHPSKALVDQPVTLRLSGFDPGRRVTVRATMRDDTDVDWESHADFLTDGEGVIDPAVQAPLAGTYGGIDPMGLFWSMVAQTEHPQEAYFERIGLAPTPMTITAEVNGNEVAAATLERQWIADGVAREPVSADGLVGTFFYPNDGRPHPGIIVLGGSDGGLHEDGAALLASHGYAALALAYFRADPLPSRLIELPLEYGRRAIQWMQEQEAVAPGKLAVVGDSKGGELALLLGSMFPAITAVVSICGSSVVLPSIGRSIPEKNKAAWTYQGAPLKPMRLRIGPGDVTEYLWKQWRKEPYEATPLHVKTMRRADAVRRATMPLERINGPVLLISVEDDQAWPTPLFGAVAMERMENFGHPYAHEHLCYPGAGHALSHPPMSPYLPTTGNQLRHPVDGVLYGFGGNPEADAACRADYWTRVLEFLDQSLNG